MLDSKTFSVDSYRLPNVHIFWRSAIFRVYFNLGVGLRSLARCYSESVDILCFACTFADRSTQHTTLILEANFFEGLSEINNPRSLQTPDIVARVWQTAKETDPDIAESAVKQRLKNILTLWNELFPAEQERLMRQLLERVVVKPDGIEILLHQEGLGDFARSLYCPSGASNAA